MEDIERGRVFFLGAGFSAGAGVPLTNVLLPKAATLFRDQAAGLFDRIGWWASDADVDLTDQPDAADLARLCTQLDFMELREHWGGERWSVEGSRERLALKFFLAKAIAISTPPASQLPSYYVAFAKGLLSNDVIVSFNWDTLVENLLDYAGVPYSYTWEQGKVLILKLHGSVNWRQDQRAAMGRDAPNLNYRPIGYDTADPKNDIHWSDKLLSPEAWQASRSLTHEVRPMIVLPGYGKAVDVRLLSAIWYKPEFLAMRQGGISIVGLSVADDDFIVDGLLRYFLRGAIDETIRVRVVNPDPKVGEKFAQIAGAGRKISFFEDYFSDQSLPSIMFEDAQ